MDDDKSEALLLAISGYADTIDSLYGHYLDSCQGFQSIADAIEHAQQHVSKDIPRSDLDSLPFFIGKGDPNDPNHVVLHRTTQGLAKARNRDGGTNHIRAAHWLVVLIFEYWETEFRSEIAKCLSMERDDLKVDVLGDIRLLRQAVIHRQGVIREDAVAKLKKIKGQRVGSVLTLSGDEVFDIVREVKAALDDIAVSAELPDPNHRTIWRLG